MDRFNPEVSFNALESGIIDEDLIRKSLDEEGPKGEAGRLLLQDGIVLAEVTSIRLEFLKILAIDHLWMMTSLLKLNLSNNIIEKIENLDALTNLKDLSLSFNNIKKLENLDKLTKLEILTLFENQISRIENLDSLYNLKILSIGNNKISDWDDMVYLRKFKALHSLNMAGNPCCSENALGDGKRTKLKERAVIEEVNIRFGDGQEIDPQQRKEEFRKYSVALLPQLHFYEYKLVDEEERRNGQEKYRHKLLTLNNEEEKVDLAHRQSLEEEDLANKEKAAWVENLRGTELFQEVFRHDPYGDALITLDETMQEIYDEFRAQFTAVTTDLYKIGLVKKEERDEEENQFVLCLKKAKEGNQKEGESIMTDLFKEKSHTFSEITRLAQRLEGGGTVKPDAKEVENGNGDVGGTLVEVSTLGEEEFEGEELVARMQLLGEEFKDHCHKAWTQLMAMETHLYEQIEDTMSTFERNLSELVASFIESAQVHFVSCRDFAAQFHEKIATAAPRYFAATRARIAAYNAKVVMHEEAESSEHNRESIHDQDEDIKDDDCPSVPKILEQCLENKDALQNVLITSHDSHLQTTKEWAASRYELHESSSVKERDERHTEYVPEWDHPDRLSKKFRKHQPCVCINSRESQERGRKNITLEDAKCEKIRKKTVEEVDGNRKRLHEIITVTNLLKEELDELQESSITLPMLAEMEIMEG